MNPAFSIAHFLTIKNAPLIQSTFCSLIALMTDGLFALNKEAIAFKLAPQ